MPSASQVSAESILPHLLADLPDSLPLARRVQNPLRPPFSAIYSTIPPACATPPEIWTAIFVERSARDMTQAHVYSSFQRRQASCSSPEQLRRLQRAAAAQLRAVLAAAKATPPTADPVLLLGHVDQCLIDLLGELQLVAKQTPWTKYVLATATLPADTALPADLHFGSVREHDLPLVIATSAIRRHAHILQACQSAGVFTADGQMVAWAYVNLAGALSTLYVLPEYRRRGLAKAVLAELMRRAAEAEGGGDFLGHANVSEENLESRRVMEGLGGRYVGMCGWVWVDLERLGPESVDPNDAAE